MRTRSPSFLMMRRALFSALSAGSFRVGRIAKAKTFATCEPAVNVQNSAAPVASETGQPTPTASKLRVRPSPSNMKQMPFISI